MSLNEYPSLLGLVQNVCINSNKKGYPFSDTRDNKVLNRIIKIKREEREFNRILFLKSKKQKQN